jgi:hypothetical protein
MKRELLAVFLLFVITGAMLSVAAVYVPAIVNEGWARQKALGGLLIVANELPEKPQSYFTLENPDAYVLQAISNRGQIVFVGNSDKTQIDEEIHAHGGNQATFEFNNHYYSLGLGSATPTEPDELVLVTILNIGWILWGASIIIAAIINIVIARRKKRPNKTTEPQ